MKVQLPDSTFIHISIEDLADDIWRFAHITMDESTWQEWRDSEESDAAIDCRLRAIDGWWELKVGLSDFDTDHCGYWSVGSIPEGCTRAQSRAIAKELIESLE